MAVTRPYARTLRPQVDGRYGGPFISDPRYAQEPEQFVHAYLLLQKDFVDLLDYVEPSDGNEACHSFRIQALLLRACVEVETNCKAILRENGYGGGGDWNMSDYRLVNRSHRLSSYKVVIPRWRGAHRIRTPFANWDGKKALPWYQAYNRTKHDRHVNFADASFAHLIDAVCAVVALLSAQFGGEDFSGRDGRIVIGNARQLGEEAIGEFFRVVYPDDWPVEERYDFRWQALELTDDAIQRFAYVKG